MGRFCVKMGTFLPQETAPKRTFKVQYLVTHRVFFWYLFIVNTMKLNLPVIEYLQSTDFLEKVLCENRIVLSRETSLQTTTAAK